ncbi:F-box only protein 3-like [Perognathus longimembris pacificus]|uniref:F-box only protein 3-like n=1 Tax=Perognathus longimembris pacificus TaxID=214514 RepID=UPI00201990C6|nr:F-box only protein 3-like [Perognathus longimembris pacificus]
MAAMDGEPSMVSLESLPADPLLIIFSLLDYGDLVNCCLVNRRFNQIASYDLLWRKYCTKYWLITEEEKVRKNECWKSLFIDFYSDVGRYIEHYAAIKKAWDDLKKYLWARCPLIVLSLKDGLREEDLDAIEAQIGCKLPDDYRCSFRIHNGQKLVVPGLFGSIQLLNHQRSEDFLDALVAAGGFQPKRGLKYCLPLTFCVHTGLSQYLAVEAAEGRNKNEVFYHSSEQMTHTSNIEMFITGSSFTEWFTSYVNNVVSGRFPVIRNQILRYMQDPECVATTGDITVSVSTSFLPELSSINPPQYFFSYRINVEMSSDARPDEVCHLYSRCLRATNANGNMEVLQGPGIEGELPTLTAGEEYEYIGCTTFSTTSGYIEGYYTFYLQRRKDRLFRVTVPRFYLECPKFKVFRAR